MARSSQISGKGGNILFLKVAPEAIGRRLDTYLASELSSLSRSQIKRLIDEGRVATGSGKRLKGGQKLKGTETLEVIIPEPEPIEALPENIPLTILYEDSSIIVIDKPAGMVVHPAAGHFEGTLVNALLFHCRDLSGIGGKLRPGIVHRLDKDTSGVMMATKNDQAHHIMANQFRTHTIIRKYKALVYGHMDEEGTIDLPLGRHFRDRKKISVVEGGRRAVTRWRVLRSYRGISLLELTLETGRTHQIRVHLSKTGHPIVGDRQYGSDKRSKEIPSQVVRKKIGSLKRQALHAYLLGFKHPASGKQMEFTSPLPDDMEGIIQALELETER